MKLLSLPRELGAHPETGKKIIVNIGRFGPYIGHDGKFKSIPRSDSIFDTRLERAVELLAQAREGNAVLRVLGDHPDDKASVEICSGRYGTYVRHGKVNATLPKGTTPEEITLEEGLALLAARVAKGPVVKKGAARKKPASGKKPATKKAPAAKKEPAVKKPVAKKPVAKKSVAKKPAAKKT